MIDIRNLTKDYGTTRALDGVSFTVARGEVLGLLGPNGAGKTTTMRILTGYVGPTSGSVAIEDVDVGEQPLQAKRRIGYLPEFAPLYADMLVNDYLEYVARVREVPSAERAERIARVVAQCGLPEVAYRPFRELSRGYKQRVGLAHALIGDPDILVLDEPTAGLDPNQIVEIRNIIREAGRTKTVILSTHILSEAESTCDRIVIINRGRVVANGTADQVKAAAISGMEIRIGLAGTTTAEVERVLLALDAVTGVSPVADAAADTPAGTDVLVDVRCASGDSGDSGGSDDPGRDIYLAVKAEDWILTQLQATRQSLEDTFRELTEHPRPATAEAADEETPA